MAKNWHPRCGHALTFRASTEEACEGLLPHIKCGFIDRESYAESKFEKSSHGILTKDDKICVLHVNTKGKIETTSVDGHGYVITKVEEHSRFITDHHLRSKAYASEEPLKFVCRF